MERANRTGAPETDADDRAVVPGDAPQTRGGRHLARRILSVVCIVLGLILVPLAATLHFASTALTNTDAFVKQLAPLAEDPAVQEAIVDSVQSALSEQIDVAAAVSGALDGLQELGLSDLGRRALGVFEAPIVEGIHGALHSATAGLVASEAFADTWREALRISHTSLSAALQGKPDSILRFEANTVALDLTPVLETVRSQLADTGWGSVLQVRSDTELVVPIAEVEQLPLVQGLASFVIVAGSWAMPIAVLVLIAGVAFAVRRARSVVIIGLGIAAISAVLLLLGSALRQRVTALEALNPEALGSLFDAAVGPLGTALTQLLWLGLLIAGIGLMIHLWPAITSSSRFARTHLSD